MPSVRYFPFLLTGVGILCLAGAWRYPAGKRSEPDAPPPDLAGAIDLHEDPRAKQVLADAVRRWHDNDAEWVQSTVWMRFHLAAARSVGEGTYVQAPGNRYRLELRTRPDAQPGAVPAGALVIVGDGRDHWQASRSGPGDFREVKRLRLTELPPVAVGGPLVQGPKRLLNNLLTSLTWVRRSSAEQDIVLVGVWPAWVRAAQAPPGRKWPVALPRLFRLTLRGGRGWPARLEWWGPHQEDGPDLLIAEVEFRDPAFGTCLADDECARLFHFDPGLAVVEGPAH